MFLLQKNNAIEAEHLSFKILVEQHRAANIPLFVK